jgi:phenylalanyl-tRNA synthetase beta chain
MFSEYASTPFQVEQVVVEYESAPTAFIGVADDAGATSTRVKEQTTPDLSARVATASPSSIAGTIGATVSASAAATLLSKMGLEASVVAGDARAAATSEAAASARGGGGITASRDDPELLRVLVPPTRADVLHECDIAEDVAIAFGYNNIERTLPKSATTGGELPVNALTDALRRELVAMGCDEALT